MCGMDRTFKEFVADLGHSSTDEDLGRKSLGEIKSILLDGKTSRETLEQIMNPLCHCAWYFPMGAEGDGILEEFANMLAANPKLSRKMLDALNKAFGGCSDEFECALATNPNLGRKKLEDSARFYPNYVARNPSSNSKILAKIVDYALLVISCWFWENGDIIEHWEVALESLTLIAQHGNTSTQTLRKLVRVKSEACFCAQWCLDSSEKNRINILKEKLDEMRYLAAKALKERS